MEITVRSCPMQLFTLPKEDFFLFHVECDRLARADFAFEYRRREHVDDLLLDQALERACAEEGIVAFLGKIEYHFIFPLQVNFALKESLLQSSHLDQNN